MRLWGKPMIEEYRKNLQVMWKIIETGIPKQALTHMPADRRDPGNNGQRFCEVMSDYNPTHEVQKKKKKK